MLFRAAIICVTDGHTENARMSSNHAKYRTNM